MKCYIFYNVKIFIADGGCGLRWQSQMSCEISPLAAKAYEDPLSPCMTSDRCFGDNWNDGENNQRLGYI